MKLQSTIVLLAILVAALTMQGCATPQTPPKFPDASSATSAGGTFVNIANLRNVDKGLSKDQMYDLLGPPHFALAKTRCTTCSDRRTLMSGSSATTYGTICSISV